MQIGVAVYQAIADPIDHPLRDLCARGVIETDPGLAGIGQRQRRKLATDDFNGKTNCLTLLEAPRFRFFRPGP